MDKLKDLITLTLKTHKRCAMPKLANTLIDIAARNLKPNDKPFKVAAGRGASYVGA